jgi:beta-glucosidase
MSLRFPPGFLWGAATSAYQVEGCVDADGRGQSIWDTFCREPGRTHRGEAGDVAADHYRRFEQDVELMADLGLQAYRFSVAWPRIQPSGRGAPNERGLDFYRRLVESLNARGILPFLTLYHWDLPQALEDAGGWPARDTAERFVEYAAIVYDALADGVRHWATLNEPWCSAFLGYADGRHAPGIRDPRQAFAAHHHLLLAHGRAVRTLRGLRGDRELGIVLNLFPVVPASGDPADAEAARAVDLLHNRLFLDPLLRGSYPADAAAHIERIRDLDFVRPGDLEDIAAPLDFLGVNYYHRHRVRANGAGGPGAHPGAEVEFVSSGRPRTAMGWEIEGEGLAEVLVRLDREYPRLPLYVTENGAAFDDGPDADGVVRDDERVRFLEEHLRAAHTALRAGVDLRGYFVWSLLDNFEWAEGYSKRFGIVYVDYETQRRTPKESAAWYRDVVARSGPV